MGSAGIPFRDKRPRIFLVSSLWFLRKFATSLSVRNVWNCTLSGCLSPNSKSLS